MTTTFAYALQPDQTSALPAWAKTSPKYVEHPAARIVVSKLRRKMSVLDAIKPFVDEGRSLAMVGLYVDEDLGGQCVGAHLAFPEKELYIYAEGVDDSICVSEAFPAALSDGAIRVVLAPFEWTSAIGHPILWAWTMTNTQGRVDGLQIEFGAVDHPSVTLQVVVRASTLVLRTL
ncbi:DUF6334 family protein [Sorangium sp. So ce302]|uniref:DUF6334 family protein n=1 Tax=Sorangium sp. So ce302 TaxID=3133297 RepID=UPI003F63E2BA